MTLKIVNTVYFLIITQKRCEKKLDETNKINSKNWKFKLSWIE